MDVHEGLLLGVWVLAGSVQLLLFNEFQLAVKSAVVCVCVCVCVYVCVCGMCLHSGVMT